jgi:membrane protein required for colicin V production
MAIGMVSPVDWSLLVVLLMSVMFGAWRGVIYEVLSLFSWVVAFSVASFFSGDMGAYLPLGKSSDGLRDMVGFGCVFVLSLVVTTVMIAMLRKFVETVGLRPVDRALGAVFGLFRGVVLLMAVLLLASKTPLHHSAEWQASMGVNAVASLVKMVLPRLPTEVTRYLPELPS